MSQKSKTKERILKTALGLFNNEGEAEISTVDIAAVLEISPGNLYYHYKGKDAIIEALFDDFEEELRQVLSAPINKPLAIDDNWIYLYIIFEEIYDFRFFYNAIPTILERCPDLQPRFARLLALKHKTAEAILKALESAEVFAFREGELTALSERIAMQITYWLQYCALKNPTQDAGSLIHDGVFSLLSQITPYLGKNSSLYADLLSEFYAARRK